MEDETDKVFDRQQYLTEDIQGVQTQPHTLELWSTLLMFPNIAHANMYEVMACLMNVQHSPNIIGFFRVSFHYSMLLKQKYGKRYYVL